MSTKQKELAAEKELNEIFAECDRIRAEVDVGGKDRAGIGSREDDLREMRHELKELGDSVRQLSREIRLDRDNARHDREKLLLQLENMLLRTLPLAKQAPGNPKSC